MKFAGGETYENNVHARISTLLLTVLKNGAIIIIEQRNEDRIDDLHPPCSGNMKCDAYQRRYDL
ncbi:MAG: hypothetical protein IIY69_02510, partial [Clostridia bacterium]|nr:hypothetical protein [Clostridia bacterium]